MSAESATMMAGFLQAGATVAGVGIAAYAAYRYALARDLRERKSEIGREFLGTFYRYESIDEARAKAHELSPMVSLYFSIQVERGAAMLVLLWFDFLEADQRHLKPKNPYAHQIGKPDLSDGQIDTLVALLRDYDKAATEAFEQECRGTDGLPDLAKTFVMYQGLRYLVHAKMREELTDLGRHDTRLRSWARREWPRGLSLFLGRRRTALDELRRRSKSGAL